jgi:hypothetical protein
MSAQVPSIQYQQGKVCTVAKKSSSIFFLADEQGRAIQLFSSPKQISKALGSSSFLG